MKTVITLTIEHTKPLPDITDVICQRVWPYGGGCITDMTAEIQEERTELTCGCEACSPQGDGFKTPMRMIVCATCGNKRCPRATRHSNVCNGSNEPGQAGSSYPARTEAAATGTFRVGNETFSKERMREAIKAGRAQS